MTLLPQVVEFFKQLNIAMCCRATLYTLQSLYVNNAVYNFWTTMQERIFTAIREQGEAICISGDGQFDSPGFTAYQLFYR